jgi:hypothetical protein
MREKDAQVKFKEINNIHGFFELKLCKAKPGGHMSPLPFDRVAPHQWLALLAVNHEQGLYHKITDVPVSQMQKEGEEGAEGKEGKKLRFTKPKPFDCFFLKNTPAYVVICFYEPRKTKMFTYIPIDCFMQEKSVSSRKSLTMQRAMELAEYIK